MRTLGRLMLWLGGLLGFATLGIAWWVGLNGLFGIPALYRCIALGVVAGSVLFLVLGLILTGPAKDPNQPKATKAKGKDKAAPKGH